MVLGPELQEPGGCLFELAEVLSLGGVERRRGLKGELIEHVSAGGEGVGAMLNHTSRQVVQGRDGLGSQACEHGVGAPAVGGYTGPCRVRDYTVPLTRIDAAPRR